MCITTKNNIENSYSKEKKAERLVSNTVNSAFSKKESLKGYKSYYQKISESEEKKIVNRFNRRIENHQLKYISQRFFTEEEKKKTQKTTGIVGSSRLCFCGSQINFDDNPTIDIARSQSGKLYFKGLAACGSAWRCPICSLKISEHRGNQVKDIFQKLLSKNDINASFTTFTISHKKDESLSSLLEFINKQFANLAASKLFRNLRKSGLLIGYIKSLEITYSNDNGFHPHLHCIFFFKVRSESMIKAISKKVVSFWANSRKNKERGTLLKYQDFKFVGKENQNHILAEYISKWDLAKEVSKGHFKDKNKGNYKKNIVRMSPFGVLKMLNNKEFDIITEQQLKAVYYEYINATLRKKQIFFSKELSKINKEIEKSDEKIVSEDNVLDVILMSIDRKLWKVISKNRLQAYVLNEFERNGINGVLELLSEFTYIQKEDKTIKHKVRVSKDSVVTQVVDLQLVYKTEEKEKEKIVFNEYRPSLPSLQAIFEPLEQQEIKEFIKEKNKPRQLNLFE